MTVTIPAWFIQIITAFFGAVGFAVLFNVQRPRLYWAGLGGLLGWAIYLAGFALGMGDYPATFVAAFCFTLYSEPMAQIMKTPSTVFLVPAAIPMVPGASLFRSMRFAVHGEWDFFTRQILHTLLLAASIAGGIVCGMTAYFIVRKIWSIYASHRRRLLEEAGGKNSDRSADLKHTDTVATEIFLTLEHRKKK